MLNCPWSKTVAVLSSHGLGYTLYNARQTPEASSNGRPQQSARVPNQVILLLPWRPCGATKSRQNDFYLLSWLHFLEATPSLLAEARSICHCSPHVAQSPHPPPPHISTRALANKAFILRNGGGSSVVRVLDTPASFGS